MLPRLKVDLGIPSKTHPICWWPFLVSCSNIHKYCKFC